MTASIIERIGETIESKKVKGIPLSKDEGLHAASIAEQYGLKPDTAELIILCRKIKAKKLITTAEIPFELRQNLRPLTITTPDEESR